MSGNNGGDDDDDSKVVDITRRVPNPDDLEQYIDEITIGDDDG